MRGEGIQWEQGTQGIRDGGRERLWGAEGWREREGGGGGGGGTGVV
jgi:hypothetical protein